MHIDGVELRLTPIESGYDSNVIGVRRFSGWAMTYGIRPCGIAVCFVLVALLWTFPLQRVVAYPFLFLFFGAIMGSAWFGGAISGFVAVILSSLVVNFFFIPPLYSIAVAKEFRGFLGAFILCAIAISVVSSARKRAENAARFARDQLELKVRERTAELEHSNLEIKESERQLRILTEAIPQQIWRADASGQIEYCNQHLRDYVGGARALLGESFFSILHPQDEPLFRQAWAAAIEAGGSFEVEARARGANGVYRWFLVRSIPQRLETGEIARWYGIHIDVEELHRAQQSLLVAQDELSRLSRTLSMAEMAASIAHELNQPVTAVVTHAYACREWLLSEPANVEKASATAEKIVQEGTRASAVVKRVRALFQKEAEVRELVDINTLIRDLVRLIRDEAIRRNVSIQLRLASDLPKTLIDPVQVQQVILNLATNGMDAMMGIDGPRELTIRSGTQKPDEIVIAVEDRGAGIPPESAKKIFEPFFSTKPHGTGLGLALCRSIIEAHDGRLWAGNSAQGGAVVQFTLRTRS
jgi:PAS domain S-box-containing protein